MSLIPHGQDPLHLPELPAKGGDDAGIENKESVGKSDYASFKKTITSSKAFEAIKSISKNCYENIQQAYTTSKSFFIGTIGRFSPTLETKLHSPKDQETLNAIQKDLKEMKAIQTAIHDLKSAYPLFELKKAYVTKMNDIKVKYATEIEPLERSIVSNTELLSQQKRELDAAKQELKADPRGPNAEALTKKIGDFEKNVKRIETIIASTKTKMDKIGESEKKEAARILHDGVKTVGLQILGLRRQWRDIKIKLESHQNELLGTHLEHSSAGRKLATEEKASILFQYKIIQDHDRVQFTKDKKALDGELKKLRTLSTALEPSLEKIKEGLTKLDERASLAKVGGNTALADEIEAYATTVRSDPLLADHPEKEIPSLLTEMKNSILSPDFHSDTVQAKYASQKERRTGLLQAVVMRATQGKNYQPANSAGPKEVPPTPPRYPEASLTDRFKRIEGEVIALKELVAKHPDSGLKGHVQKLIWSLESKKRVFDSGLNGTGSATLAVDIEKISDAIAVLESELNAQAEEKDLLFPKTTTMRELEHIKQALIDSKESDSKLILREGKNGKWLEVKARDAGPKLFQGTSKEAQTTVDYLLKELSSQSADPNLHTIAKEIIDLINGHKWVTATINNGGKEAHLEQTTRSVNDSYAEAQIAKQLNNLTGLLESATRGSKFLAIRTDGTGLDLEFKLKSPEKGMDELSTKEKGRILASTNSVLGIIGKALNKGDLRDAALKLLTHLEKSPQFEAIASEFPELKEKIEGLRSVTASDDSQIKKDTLDFLNTLIGPPENSKFQERFLNSSGFFLDKLFSGDQSSPDSVKLFSFLAATLQNPETSFYGKQQLLKLAEKWVNNPALNNLSQVPEAKAQLQAFIEIAKKENSPTLNTLVEKLSAAIKTDETKAASSVETVVDGTEDFLPTLTKIRNGEIPRTTSTGKRSEEYQQAVKDFAKSLQVESAKHIKRIKPSEFTDAKWVGNPKQAPNIKTSIEAATKLSNFATSQIIKTEEGLSTEKIQQNAANAMLFFIDVQSELLSQENEVVDFNSIIALQTGLTKSAVVRMKKTIALLPKEALERMAQFDALANANKSFKNMRASMAESSKPFIPFLGMYLSDITFMNDGNKTTLENGQVNAKKANLIGKAIGEIVDTGQRIPVASSAPQFSFARLLEASKDYNEDASYQLSLKIEPREKSPPPAT